ncbi:hypothetical protein SBA2_140006 [Acidobacteriia bacterium SbA2]|nr:hypothetical protein SBA2_140006 [Acidobacteriia bacterium SbA2]
MSRILLTLFNDRFLPPTMARLFWRERAGCPASRRFCEKWEITHRCPVPSAFFALGAGILTCHPEGDTPFVAEGPRRAARRRAHLPPCHSESL